MSPVPSGPGAWWPAAAITREEPVYMGKHGTKPDPVVEETGTDYHALEIAILAETIDGCNRRIATEQELKDAAARRLAELRKDEAPE